MNITQRFLEYADAFEQTYADNDWSRLERYFTENSTYQFEDQRAEGRAALLDMLRGSVNGLDRQMDRRAPNFAAPTADGDTVHMDWQVTYTKSGCPDLVISGHETAVFEGDRIAALRDELSPAARTALATWMSEHAGKLAS